MKILQKVWGRLLFWLALYILLTEFVTSMHVTLNCVWKKLTIFNKLTNQRRRCADKQHKKSNATMLILCLKMFLKLSRQNGESVIKTSILEDVAISDTLPLGVRRELVCLLTVILTDVWQLKWPRCLINMSLSVTCVYRVMKSDRSRPTVVAVINPNEWRTQC